MALKSTRKILSVILAVLIATSCVSLGASTVIGETFATKSFFVKHIVTSELVKQCETQLDSKFEVLEKKSGIPARVFGTIKESYKTRDALNQAVEYIFDENDSSLYNENRVDYFYNMCVEYLEGNDFKYDEKNVKNVAREAARIYSDSVGIHNTDELKYYIQSTSIACKRVQSIGVLVLAISIIMILIMFKKRQEGALYIGSGLIAGGFATIIGVILKLAFASGGNYSYFPSVYIDCFVHMQKLCFLFIALAGLVFVLAGIGVLAFSVYKINLEQSRKDSRFSKIVTKL